MEQRLIYPVIVSAYLSVGCLSAQQVLTLEDAFKIALNNNFRIKVLENQSDIAENSVTLGNAGLLPVLNANAGAGGNITDTKLEFAGNIPPVDIDNALSTNLNAGLSANYTLFRGLSGIRQYEKLKLNASAVDAQQRAAVESTLLQVANAYYILSRATDQVRIASGNVAVSKTRYDRMNLAAELGTALRTEMLSARVALTSDSADLLGAKLQQEAALRALSLLLGTELESGAVTEPLTVELRDWSEEGLLQAAKANNALLKNLELQTEMALKDYKISAASAFPTLSVTTGYGYNRQQNQAGIILANTSLGWNGSVALSYPIFNGFRTRNAMQNQRITMDIRELERQEMELQLRLDIRNAWSAYRQSIELAGYEEKNLEAAELNLRRSQELLLGGQMTSVQFREAQVALAAAQVRISNARISVRLNELELMRLTGQILN